MNKIDFKHHRRRQNETTKQRFIRIISGSVFSILYILFSFWAGWGWLLLLPLIIDFYFIGFINWGWYQRIRNKSLRSFCTLVADILFAVIGVTLLSIFFIQNFAIPTSSLEKTLLIGDYLFVEKVTYGPRMPVTPIAMPLTHNTLPGGGKSYLDAPRLKYKRLKGKRGVERMDLVVFNFPAGDTVALKMPNPDYYTLCNMYGRQRVHEDKALFGDIVTRPVDRRDHYVKRCVGIAGDTLEIRNNQIYINGKAQENPPKMQLNYWVQTDGTTLSKELLDQLGINYRDLNIAASGAQSESLCYELGIEPMANGNYGAVFHLPLTAEMKKKISKEPYVVHIKTEEDFSQLMYPIGAKLNWTRDNYGPIYIPAKGTTIELTPENIALYSRCIHAYEGHDLTVSANGKVLIDGTPATSYTFEQDYYWMMGDNRHMSADSRYWGFVPEDHIVGRPALLWLSLNSEQSLFGGKIRWSRMMRTIKAH